ncbi:hypothetical protein SPE_0774 [Spiroplasma eriocheiris CCTCC M 207170]|nr:hypothetical protein SPE_0774 [Spiroplasma eriocheiris CCTCC M 207170]
MQYNNYLNKKIKNFWYYFWTFFGVLILLSIGIIITFWQVGQNSNQKHKNIININQYSHDYSTYQSVIKDTTSTELKNAVLSIPTLDINLKLVVNDPNSFLTTTSILSYDGKYHDVPIEINANNTLNFAGIATINMNLRVKQIDISVFNQDISSLGNVEIKNTTPQSIREGLLNSEVVYHSIAETLFIALQDPKIIIKINQTIPDDGSAHIVGVNINAEQTDDYLGVVKLVVSFVIK